MAITKPKGLKFPKVDYKKKINGITTFSSTTETATLEATAQWDGLHGIQLDHLPARAADAIGQTIADPVVTVAGSPRTVRFKTPDGTEPVVGECYIDLYSGTIQFNSADAGLAVSCTYYIRADLIDHNAMNRIHQAGHTYLVSDATWADFSDLQECFNACVDGDSVKLMKDVTTTGLTLAAAIKLEGNNRKIIKSGTVTGSRAITFSHDLIVRDLQFQGWDEASDICLYASADVKAIISSNNAIGQTKLTNADSVCTNAIVENNLPFSENVGQATNIITNNLYDKVVAQLTASTAVSIGDPMFLDLTDPTKCKKSTGPTDTDAFIGIAMNNASIGQTVNVAGAGYVSGLSGLTAGKTYYVNTSGNLATLTFPDRPLPAMNANFGYNPLIGTSGQTMHSVVGQALSSTVMFVRSYRLNNITPIDGSSSGLNILVGQTISIGGTITRHLFGTGSGADFPTSRPWRLELEMWFRANALTASASAPEFQATLKQNLASGYASPQDIEKWTHAFINSSGDLSGGYTGQFTTSFNLTNMNPGFGEAKLVFTMSTPISGSYSGTVTFRITKARLVFL